MPLFDDFGNEIAVIAIAVVGVVAFVLGFVLGHWVF
jgi:hypothetical protein